MATVFVYGPDSLQGRMYDKLGPCNVLGGAMLPGHRLAFDKPNMKREGEGFANLSADKDAETFGVVYELTKQQVELLDGYYGGYAPKELNVLLQMVDDEGVAGEPKRMKARILIARRTGRDLKPSASSLEATKKGAEENGAPEAFIESLGALETIDD